MGNWGVMFFIWARVLRTLYFVRSFFVKEKCIMISNYRSMDDLRYFGFELFGRRLELPEVLKWTTFYRDNPKVNCRLFMVSFTAEELENSIIRDSDSYDLSIQKRLERLRMRGIFIKAVDEAIKICGSDIQILLAANTKRLFPKGELEKMYPNTSFTLGDNFTGLLLGSRIVHVFYKFFLNMEVSANHPHGFSVKKVDYRNVLIIAPYGMLGSVSLWFVMALKKKFNFNVILMINPERRGLVDKITEKHNETRLRVVCSYQEIMSKAIKVDMIIACNNSSRFALSKEISKKIRRRGEKILFIDPCEPYALRRKEFKEVEDYVIRCDAGNGMSPNLHYSFGFLFPHALLGFRNPNEIWGCFCETMILSLQRKNLPQEVNWNSEPTTAGIRTLIPYLNEEVGFTNTDLTNFGYPIKEGLKLASSNIEKREEVAYDLIPSHSC